MSNTKISININLLIIIIRVISTIKSQNIKLKFSINVFREQNQGIYVSTVYIQLNSEK